jgi:hypothetical protein
VRMTRPRVKGEAPASPITQDRHVVIPTVPIATTLPSEGTPAPLTIPTVLLQTAMPQPTPDSSLIGYEPIRRSSITFYKLTLSVGPRSDGANLSMSEKPLRPTWPNYTTTIPHFRQSGPQQPTVRGQCSTIAMASQNIATTVVLLDTLPTPSVDGVHKVYQQLRNILGTTTAQ